MIGKKPFTRLLIGLLVIAALGLWVLRGDDNSQLAAGHLLSTPASSQTSLPPALELLWKYDTSSYIEKTPLLAGDTLYVIVSSVRRQSSSCRDDHGGWCYQLLAFEMATGKLKWTLDDYEYQPTVADGVIYSGWGGELHAIDTATHQVKWKYKTAKVTNNAPFVTGDVKYAPAVADGVVYFGSGETLYALYADTGLEKWRVKYTDEIASSPVVFGGFVYVVGHYVRMSQYSDVMSYQANMYAVRKDNGQQLWKFEPEAGFGQPGAVRNPVVADDGTVYCTSIPTGVNEPGYVLAFDGKTGGQLWKHLPGTGQNYYPYPVVVQDGTLYFEVDDDGLYAMDTGTGQPQWTFDLRNIGPHALTIVQGVLYVTTTEGTVYGIDAKSGKEAARYLLGENYYSEIVATDRDVYFVGRHPNGIYAFVLPK
ncbi:MAG: PQQ-binding-like beta-propeller repeat protein [Chloroflexia bacterium]